MASSGGAGIGPQAGGGFWGGVGRAPLPGAPRSASGGGRSPFVWNSGQGRAPLPGSPRSSSGPPRPPGGISHSGILGGPPGAASPPAPPQSSDTGQAPTGLDAIAAGNEATNLFNVNNKISALTEQGAQNNVALQSALAGLNYQQPLDQLRALQAENARGGYYSSVNAAQQQQLAHSYATRRDALTGNAQNAADKIAAEIQALRGGVPLYNSSQALASIQRAIAAAEKNPATVAPNPVAGKKTGKGTTSGAAVVGGVPVTNPTVKVGDKATGPGTQHGIFTGNFFQSPGQIPRQQPNPAARALAHALAGRRGGRKSSSGGAGY